MDAVEDSAPSTDFDKDAATETQSAVPCIQNEYAAGQLHGQKPVHSSTARLAYNVGTVSRLYRTFLQHVMRACHEACDVGELILAARLLDVAEDIMAREPKSSLPPYESARALVAAHERLWELRVKRTDSE